MPTKVQVPPLGESVTQAVLVSWHKKDGDTVAIDEPICELETDKANVDLPANSAGVLRRLKNEGETVNVGDAVAEIGEAGVPAASPPATPAAATAPKDGLPTPAESSSAPTAVASPAAAAQVPLEDLSPAVRRLVEEHKLDPASIPPTGPGGRLTKEDVQKHLQERPQLQAPARQQPSPPIFLPAQAEPPITPPPTPPRPPVSAKPSATPTTPPTPTGDGKLAFNDKGVAREPMTKIRKRIAETLVQARQVAAILTTFNEVDLTEVLSLRSKFKEQFEKAHGIGLGFMSFFAKAIVQALHEVPRVNAFIEGNDILYHNYVNLGIAVSTERGLAVPVLRNVQEMSFARIENEIKRLATAVRDGKLGLEELSGATFSITNGGVFGSLLSTPILTPPQSGILGMHTIQKRPVVINDKIEVRSMMYLALSYDHRLVDGKEAITFLVRVKQLLEDPARLMLEV